MSSDKVTDARALSPLQALERIRRIVKDGDLTPSEKLAVIAIVLHANTETGLAFPGQRTIRRETGIGGKPVELALACPEPGESRPRGKAIGRHIEPAGRGGHGVRVWRVLPASPVGARCENGSNPQAGALNAAQRASQEPQRASQEIQRPPERRRTSVELKATGEEEAPPPIAPRSDNGNGQALGARLKVLAVKPATADEWEATAQEDLRHGRYVRADLEAYLAGIGRIACWPRDLVKDVRAFTAARRAAAFRERLRRIRADRLTDARREGDARQWRVRFVDEVAPVIILEEVLFEPAQPTLDNLERTLEEWTFDRRAAGARRLEKRIEAIRAGRPDPSPEPRGKPERKEIRTPGDLDGWTFRPGQPLLFGGEPIKVLVGAGAGGQPEGRACEGLPATEAAPAPADPGVLRMAEALLMA